MANEVWALMITLLYQIMARNEILMHTVTCETQHCGRYALYSPSLLQVNATLTSRWLLV